MNGSLIGYNYNSGVGIALDGMGDLFVANNFGGAGGNKIGEYTTTGQPVNPTLITGLFNPTGIAVAPEPAPRGLMAFGLVVIFAGILRREKAGSDFQSIR